MVSGIAGIILCISILVMTLAEDFDDSAIHIISGVTAYFSVVFLGFSLPWDVLEILWLVPFSVTVSVTCLMIVLYHYRLDTIRGSIREDSRRE